MKVLKFLGVFLAFVLITAFFLLYEADIPKDVIDARYLSPASQYLDLGDSGRIHYRDEGNRRNNTIVLLHGSNASLHTWEPWVARLSADYRVISLDLPGHGLTGEVPADQYNHDSYIAVIESLTSHLVVDSFILAGNSMGGGVAWRFALSHSERLDGLILIDSGSPAAWNIEEDSGNDVLAFSLLRRPWFRTIAERLDPYYMTVQGVKVAYNNAAMINDDLIMRYYDLNMRAGTRRATMIRFAQEFTDEKPDLSQINVPTLIMWGKADRLMPFKHAGRFKELIPFAKTAYYDNVGHMPMEETPEQSANDLIRFLQSLDLDNLPDPEQPG